MTTLRDKLNDLIYAYKEAIKEMESDAEKEGSLFESEDELIESVITDWFERETK